MTIEIRCPGRMWHMKAIVCMLALSILRLNFGASALGSDAATNGLASLLQQGLFEEEANRNLDAAIARYQSLTARFDQDRQIAATAVFRLGECYRKLGDTNEAVLEYQRILRDFSDQADLTTLSRQNLAGLGAAIQPALLPAVSGNNVPSPIPDEQAEEIRRVQAMIQNGPDLIDAVSGDPGLTPLCRAASKGELRVAEFLLANGANVNLRSPLGYAASNGQKTMVELLLRHGAAIDAQDGMDQTPLYNAVSKGFMSVAETLVAAGANPNIGNESGRTPLIVAVEKGFHPAAAILLEHGAQPNVLCRAPQGYSPSFNNSGAALHFAVIHGDDSMVQLLIRHHADVNLRDPHGLSPLDLATINDKPVVAAQLIDAGADVSAAGPQGSDGSTPLHRAVASRHADMVKLLLDRGANPNARLRFNPPGNTPLIMAAGWDDADVSKMLLEHHADPNLKTDYFTTALSEAARSNMTNTIRLLLSWHADANCRDSKNCPLLVSAVRDGVSLQSIELLLAGKADVNARDAMGNTALHFAAESARPEIAEALLAAGADPNVVDAGGLSPLDLAIRHSSPMRIINNQSVPTEDSRLRVVAILREHGALDNPPRFDRISVIRPSANYSDAVFQKGTNDWNRFSLLELIAAHYQFITTTLSGTGRHFKGPPNWNGCLAFPDFKHIVIHRPTQGGKHWDDIRVDVAVMLETGDCSRNIWLRWGDQVEIPEADHPVSDTWAGFPVQEATNLIACLSRKVDIVIQGKTTEFTPPMKYDHEFIFGQNVLERVWTSFMLRAVLDESRLVRFSSDLRRVHVRRKDAVTHKDLEWTLDCSDERLPDFWLRDGDVIDVPEK